MKNIIRFAVITVLLLATGQVANAQQPPRTKAQLLEYWGPVKAKILTTDRSVQNKEQTIAPLKPASKTGVAELAQTSARFASDMTEEALKKDVEKRRVVPAVPKDPAQE